MRWHTGLAMTALASVAVLAIAGCSWRVDTPPEAFRTPSPLTVLRDQVAAAEAEVGAQVTSVIGADGEAAAAEAAAVPIRLEALGGVSPTSSPRSSLDYLDALDMATAAAGECSQAAAGEPLGALCASIELSHSVIRATPPYASSVDVPQASVLTTDADGDVVVIARLALEHDKARALFETIAAREKGAERTRALTQSARQRQLVAELLALPGVEDLTEPAYDVPSASVATAASRTVTAREALVTLGESYAAWMVKAQVDDHSWLYEMAFEHYVGAIYYGLTAADVPALPGGVEPSAAP